MRPISWETYYSRFYDWAVMNIADTMRAFHTLMTQMAV